MSAKIKSENTPGPAPEPSTPTTDSKPGAEKGSLAERLLEIGRECSAHWKEPYRSIDHGDLLYDENGLPK